jgi:DNA-binding PadR family transcriptional regulator
MTSGSETPKRHILNGIYITRMVAGSHTLGGHFLFKPLTILNMKYTMFIDQVHSIEWGLNLQEAAIFNFLYSVPTWAEAKLIDGKLFYHASRNKAIQDYPIVSEKPDTVYRIYRRLQSAGVIEWMKDGLKDMILITEKGKQWNNSEKNPTLIQELGKKSDQTRKKIRNSSENFPTYTSTINTVTNNTIEEPQKKIEESKKQNDILATVHDQVGETAVKVVEVIPSKAKKTKYIYPPTQDELVPMFFDKLTEKKRQHPQIIDCWNWANMEAEKFFLHWERKGWQIQKLGNAIATWVNGSITFGTVTKPCPIQYKNNPANVPQPEQLKPVQTQITKQDLDARKAMFAAAKAELNQIGA